MTIIEVSVAYAKEHFSEVLARVAFAGESFLIKRRGKPMAALIKPAVSKDEEEVLRNPWLALRQLGLKNPALAPALGKIYRERKKSPDRWEPSL